MGSTLARVVGSIVVGWIVGSTVGLLLSDGEADQLPMITVPAAIAVVFALSFLAVPRRQS
jgi:hypothetical protein